MAPFSGQGRRRNESMGRCVAGRGGGLVATDDDMAGLPRLGICLLIHTSTRLSKTDMVYRVWIAPCFLSELADNMTKEYIPINHSIRMYFGSVNPLPRFTISPQRRLRSRSSQSVKIRHSRPPKNLLTAP